MPFQALGGFASGLPALGGLLFSKTVPEVPANNDLGPFEKVQYFSIVLVGIAILFCVMTRIRFGDTTSAWVRLIGGVSLHIADYVTNLLTMYVVFKSDTQRKYLLALGSVHVLVGIFCTCTAATSIEWQTWYCHPLCKFLIMFIVMGMMQGVQVKLAFDDFREQRNHRLTADSDQLVVPSSMSAKFHCKTMDGVLEGTVFAFVSMYAIIKNRWKCFDGNNMDASHIWMLYFSALFSFLTMGMALMEVDYRTSAAVQRLLNSNSIAQVRHWGFRASEVALRLLTGLVFCAFMRPWDSWWLAFVLILVDYFTGVILLLALGGKDPMREATFILGIPLLITNVMQFVDTPGMSLQAQRISYVLVPIRSMQLVGVVVFCTIYAKEIEVQGRPEPMVMWEYIFQEHTEWVLGWLLSFVLYYLLLVIYAMPMKPEADLHVAVANGEVECLRQLLCSSELVLDINRYGPDGRTPLHLAAVRAQVDCMRLLIEQGAIVSARTADKKNNTALHLAAIHKDSNAAAMRYLCRITSTDSEFLNAKNVDGDTALHVAARRQNLGALQELLQIRCVDFKIRNCVGQTAADCAPSDKFGFDRDSSECAITEIFRRAEAGSRPGGDSSNSCELSAITSSGGASGSSGPAPSPPQGKPVLHEPDIEKPASPKDESQHHVALKPISKEAEEKFLQNAGAIITTRSQISAPVTNCGISSFMLSAGMGALSRNYLASVREDEETVSTTDTQQVKASFDDFTEVKSIGEGAFGKVILVRHRETGECFAMKLMDKAKFKAQKITSKAVSEQYILKTTRHPFIVALQYAFQGSTFWALVMEFCPNGDLQDLLVRQGTPGLTLRQCARLGGECLLALEHLHRIQVIFRDLKLENVVLDMKLRAKLTDFGLAKKLYTSNDARTMCGSYGYAAPEIMLNTGRYSYSVDLYSYGVMLYMLLSGGDQAPNNPKQRLPPMRHNSLRRKLREVEKNPSAEWAKESVGVLELLTQLTSEDPKVRKTCSEVKEHTFFPTQLGVKVDKLLEDLDADYTTG
jgi:hypothetical protein